MQEPCVCDCGELSELSDMDKCGWCDKMKCVDCFSGDENGDQCCDRCNDTLAAEDLSNY